MNRDASYLLKELQALVKSELLPVYLRYYRLMNVESPLTQDQKNLLELLNTDEKLCYLVKPPTK